MTPNEHTPRDTATRRRLVAAGLAGAAVGLLQARSAAVAAPPSTTPGTEPAGTEPAGTAEAPTTTSPRRPTDADAELLALVQSVELAARDLYDEAIDAGADDPVLATVGGHHQAYVDVLSGLLGGPQPSNETLFESRRAAFGTSDVTAVAAAAYELESELVATHAEVIGLLEGLDGATMLASILITESRHCAVLADLAGLGDDLAALLDNDAEPLSAPTEA